MKKILCLVLSMVLSTALSFASCGNKKPFDMTPFEEFEEAKGVVYTGLFGTEETTVKLANGMGSVEIRTTSEVADDVICTTVERIIIASAVIEDDILTLSGKKYVTYMSEKYSGTGAEKYIADEIAEAESDMAEHPEGKLYYKNRIAVLKGEEPLWDRGDGSKLSIRYEIKVSLNDENKSCRVLKYSLEYYGGFINDLQKQKRIFEYEYASDGKLLKSSTYHINRVAIPVGETANGVNFTTFYADGKTVKTEENFILNVDGDGNYEIGDQNDLYEYREDGTQERITVWNRNSISDGSGLVTIVPGGSGIGVYIPGDPLTKDYYKNVYEFDDKENLITASGYDNQDSIKESFKITYDENGNMVSKEQYDADGNVISTVEYDEEGNEIN